MFYVRLEKYQKNITRKTPNKLHIYINSTTLVFVMTATTSMATVKLGINCNNKKILSVFLVYIDIIF